MFVVKRPFRNFGKVMTVGTVISDPTAIKHFNARFAEGKIIEVTEQTLANTAKYFKEMYGVDISATEKAEAPKAEAPKAEAPKAEAPKAEAPKAEAPKAEAPKETKAKTTTVKTSAVKASK